jgi:hypothetical protein
MPAGRRVSSGVRTLMVDLHLAEFQTPTRTCCPFRLSVIGKISPPVLRGLRVLVVSLKQQREIEHRIDVGRRGSQRHAQTIDRGFRPTLLVQQVGKIVPSFRKRRVSARRGARKLQAFYRLSRLGSEAAVRRVALSDRAERSRRDISRANCPPVSSP